MSFSSDALNHIEANAYAHLNIATEQIHWASQFLAAAGVAFVKHEADDSHTNIGWDYEQELFYSHTIAGKQPLHICLQPSTLQLSIANRGMQPLATLSLEGKTSLLI